MQYNYDVMTDRRNTGSMKWNVAENELPMWVADMDFQTAPEIIDSLEQRVSHGVYGYTELTDEWYEAYRAWWRERHGFEIKKEWLLFCTGVVPAISSVIRKLTTPAENVLVMTPVYNIFFHSILNNGRNALENRLIYRNGKYEIDFEDLEKKLSDPQTSMMLLCNPHNPIGKIWDQEILERIGDLCRKYHVPALSDEIHCDLTAPGKEYVPFASVSEACRKNSITCVSPTKAFNLAGLQTAAVIVPDENLRHRVNRALNTDEIAEPNVFAAAAPTAAFGKGGQRMDGLREYLFENRRFAEKFIEREIEGVHAVAADATYLLWLDCRELLGDSSELCRFLRTRTGLILSDGREYRDGGGFLRMNLACPRARLADGLKRLKSGTSQYQNMVSERC